MRPLTRFPMAAVPVAISAMCLLLAAPTLAQLPPPPDNMLHGTERDKNLITELKRQLEQAQKQLATLKEQLTAAQAQAGQSSQRDEEIKRLKTALDSAEKQVASLNSRNRTLESEKQGLDKQLARMQKEAAELKEQLATAQKQAGQGEQKDKELARLKAELAKVEQALSTEKNKPAKVETREVVRPVPDPAQAKELEQLRRDKQSLSTQVAELRRQLSAPAAAVPAAPPARPAVPAAQYIHGWSADKVQALQKQTADALGLPVVGKPCPKCLEEVVIPAGSFDMGSPDTEKDRDSDEGPVHRVTIGQPFALAKTEVTQGQWKAVMGSAPPELYFKNCGDDCPVERVSWDDAQAFVKKLSQKTGLSYRLPSEAEWEYTARAGTTTTRYWGNDANQACRYANVTDQKAKEKPNRFSWTIHECNDGVADTAPVGKYQPNAFGLHDMIGNVWEWVQDRYHSDYNGAPVDGSAWESGDKVGRVVRGGSWLDCPEFARSALRYNGYWPDFRDFNVGFRVARTLP